LKIYLPNALQHFSYFSSFPLFNYANLAFLIRILVSLLETIRSPPYKGIYSLPSGNNTFITGTSSSSSNSSVSPFLTPDLELISTT
jgi:hypothetical protein